MWFNSLISEFLKWRYSVKKLTIFLFSCSVLAAQPLIFPKGIVNGASYARPGVPAGAIARGSLFTIFGKTLGPAAPGVQVIAFPIGTTLSGVSVRVTQGSVGLDALPVFVLDGQLNVIMPSNAALGLASVQVTYNGVKSNPSPVQIVNSSFGAFAANSGGFGPSIVQNFVSAGVQPINSLTVTATPAQVVTLWGTGLGPANGPDNVAPTAGNLATPVEIWVGGKAVASSDILYSGRSPCCSSIDQIVFKLPTDAPQGCYVPVLVRTDHTVTSNATTIAIQSQGQSCSDSGNPFAPVYTAPSKTGTITLSRVQFIAQTDIPQPTQLNLDIGGAVFRQEPGGQFFFNSAYAFPPAGACTVYTGQGNILVQDAVPGSTRTGKSLNAGASLNLTGGSGSRQLARTGTDFPEYHTYIGSSVQSLQLPPLYLDPGNYSVAGTGGPDVGAFQAKINVLPVLSYLNLSSISTINRAQGLTVTWAMPDARIAAVAIVGGNYDVPTDSSGVFLCLAPASALAFSVPPYILGAIPQSRQMAYQSQGYLFMGTALYEPSASFTAQGLDTGFGISITASGRTVLFQ